ncbi:MAG: citrate lyase subunit alpha [Alloprevotella sp.]|nr:citrate lyase subunit alpha [Alloprevotella sp.]
MNTIQQRKEIIASAAARAHRQVSEAAPVKDAARLQQPLTDRLRGLSSPKLVSLEEAIRRSGLKDGMTISFHHHFRSGDKVINLVVAKLAEMGFKNLHLAASSLIDVHEPLIEHIRNGVITKISTSGLRGELGRAISHGLMDEPVTFRSHGTRGAAIASGELHIDVAFLGASSSDPYGNASGVSRSASAKSICGSIGYALPDARYADHVIVLTDDLVAFPNHPASISEAQVESVVEVESVGDSTKIASGAIRETKNPRDVLLAQQAARVITCSGYFVDGFSIQTGSGGASLAAVKYLREEMLKQNIKASFALGGITAHMVKMHEEGLIERLIDVQSFDMVAAASLRDDPAHQEVSANEYAAANESGSATHLLDIVILSALEVDTQFNVNVLVGSDGVIRGAIGGHPDTAADAALSIIVCPLLRGRIPCVVDEVTTLVTPGASVDVVVTEYGIAVNPSRPELSERLQAAGLKLVDIHDLAARARRTVGEATPLPFGDKVVGLVLDRAGRVLDVVRNIEE